MTISLPVALLVAADTKLADEDETRSSMLRRLIESALKKVDEREAVEQWVRSYREHPQSEDDLGWVAEIAEEQLAKIPWE